MFDFAAHNPVFLATFGESFSLVRNIDLLDASPATAPFQAINTAFDALEGVPPGDLSSYLRLWVNVADFTALPEKGDEVLTATTAYKISDIQRDDSGGMLMLCRFDRALDGE
jgi:hypothetical protein